MGYAEVLSAAFEVEDQTPAPGEDIDLRRYSGFNRSKKRIEKYSYEIAPNPNCRRSRRQLRFLTQWCRQSAPEVKELEGSGMLRVQHCLHPGCERVKPRSCSGQNEQSSCVCLPNACAGPNPRPALADRTCRLIAGRVFTCRLPHRGLPSLPLFPSPGPRLPPKPETRQHKQQASMDAGEEQAGLGESQNQDGAGMDKGGAMEEPTARRSYPTTRSIGYVGAAPSSLATLAKGKAYFVDPYTPFTPRPATLSTRDLMVLPAHAHAHAHAQAHAQTAHWVRAHERAQTRTEPPWQPCGETTFYNVCSKD
jgi:hypothetical protein